MADTQDPIDPAALVAQMSAAASALMQHWTAPLSAAAISTAAPTMEAGDLAQWGEAAQQIQGLWRDFQAERISAQAAAPLAPKLGALAKMFEGWLGANPFADPATQQRLWGDGLALFEGVLGQYGIGPRAAEAASGAATSAVAAAALPRSDRRFADPKWREGPLFALIHQSYLMLAEQALELADRAEVGDPIKRDQLRFATRTLVDMLSPANIALLNPVVLEKLRETKGQSLVKGVANLLADVKRGQLTHVDPQAFRLGDNIAATPGKVVFETPLYQLIHYTPTTEKVLEVPLVIFPPWINRFYILDLTPQKSFIRWALDHGVSVFVVSWKSADASMAEVVWDDYIAAQIEAIDHVCERLGVKAVHSIGYCVAGTTLAATLAILARRGQAAKVRSATT